MWFPWPLKRMSSKSQTSKCRRGADKWRRYHRPRLEALEDRTAPATATWINPASGFWDVASNWSGGSGPGGSPGVGDDVTISQPGNITVTFRTGTASVNNLSTGDDTVLINGGTLTWTGQWSGLVNVQNGGTLNWTAGIMSSGGNLTIAPGGTLNLGGTANKLAGSAINNGGTINWAGTGQFSTTTVVKNKPGGVFNVQTDATLGAASGFAKFENDGTFTKSGATGTTACLVAFINTGIVDAQTGTLRFEGEVTSSGTGNTFNAAANAHLVFTGSSSFANTTFSGPGEHLLNNASASFTLNGNISSTNLEFRAGALNGTYTISGTLNWSGGTMFSGSNLTIAAGSTLNISAAADKLTNTATTNAGTINWTGTGKLTILNTFTNQPNGVFNVQSDAILEGSGGGAVFNNNGTFTKSGAAGTTTCQITFNNTKIVDGQTGTLSFEGDVTSSGAGNTFNAAGGAAVTFKTNASFANTTFSGPGAHLLDLGAAGSGTLGGAINSTNLEFRSGSLNGTSTITGTFNWTGGSTLGAVTMAPLSSLNISGAVDKTLAGGAAVIDNRGTATWTGTGNLNLNNNARFNNEAGATFHAVASAALRQQGAGTSTFANAGSFLKSSGAGTTSVHLVTFTNTGTVDAQIGNLTFTNYTQTAGNTKLSGGVITADLAIQGGLVSGTGNIMGGVSNTGGTVSPGVSPGTLNLQGSYTQGASGAYTVEIGGTTAGTQFDQLNVTGAAALAGTLNVSLINSFAPRSGDSFTILTYGSLTGTFATTNLPPLSPGLSWEPVQYGATATVLRVTGTVEEPAFPPVAFAISAADAQVYKNPLNGTGQTTGAWALAAPGYFTAIATTRDGANQASLLVGLGTNGQIYAARFRGNGSLHFGWFQVAPGAFTALAAVERGNGAGAMLFGVGTDQQTYAAVFDASGVLAYGWFAVAPGAFTSLAAGRYGAGNPELFGVGVDRQVYAARFDVGGSLVNGWFSIAPGAFSALAAAFRSGGQELFGIGADQQLYAAALDAGGNLTSGWFPTASRPLTSLAAVTLGSGDVAVYGLGTDQQIYSSSFAKATGAQASGWVSPAPGLFSTLAATRDSQSRVELLGVGAGAGDRPIFGELFDTQGALMYGFFPTAPGAFTAVAVVS